MTNKSMIHRIWFLFRVFISRLAHPTPHNWGKIITMIRYISNNNNNNNNHHHHHQYIYIYIYIYIYKVETSYRSVWGFAKWRSNFAFSIFFTSFIKLYYINMCCDGPKHFHFFNFLLKSENTQFDRFANISYVFFFDEVSNFLTTYNFEKSLCSRNFLSTILQMVPLFFQRRPFFWRNCINAIRLCTILSSSLSLPLLFPLFFLFHLPYNQTRY